MYADLAARGWNAVASATGSRIHSNHRNRARGCHDTRCTTRMWLAHGHWPRCARATRVRYVLVRRARVHPGVFAGAASISEVGISIRRRTPLQLCGCDQNLKMLEPRMSADRTALWWDASPWHRRAECHLNLRNRARGCRDTGRATRTRLTHKQRPRGARATRARDARARISRMRPWVFAGAASNGTICFPIRRRSPLQLCGLAKNRRKS